MQTSFDNCLRQLKPGLALKFLDTIRNPKNQTIVHQCEQLDKLGMEVLPIEFRDAYPFGGGIHCATADVHREGDCLDYFPGKICNFDHFCPPWDSD